MTRLTGITSLVAISLAAACSSGPAPPTAEQPYEQQVLTDRARKDEFLKVARESPIPVEARAAFASLPYFAIDPTYRVPAALEENRSNPPIIIRLPNSANAMEEKVRVGTLGFTLHGTSYTLTAFAESAAGVQRLWLPFFDLTNGLDTYGGGRYLDLERTPTGLYDLDFNRAYHPYCVYNKNFICPVPPRENRLPIAIRAGERLPK